MMLTSRACSIAGLFMVAREQPLLFADGDSILAPHLDP
jgi:hypothetical protein